MHVPFDLSLAVQTYRSWEPLCACGETDGLITSCCLASVAWLNLHPQSSETVLRITCIAIAYPDPDTPAQQTVGVAIADTDNVENAENNTALCSARYT